MKTKKSIPRLQSDQEAEAFVESADLSQYDLSAFRKSSFEFETKDHSMSLRLPTRLYKRINAEAKQRGLKTQKFIRQALEHAIS